MIGIDDIKYHVKCGLHSNIPPCCVLFFIKHWIFDDEYKSQDSEQYLQKTGANGYEYLPCDTCYEIGRINTIKECTCSYPRSGTLI